MRIVHSTSVVFSQLMLPKYLAFNLSDVIAKCFTNKQVKVTLFSSGCPVEVGMVVAKYKKECKQHFKCSLTKVKLVY